MIMLILNDEDGGLIKLDVLLINHGVVDLLHSLSSVQIDI